MSSAIPSSKELYTFSRFRRWLKTTYFGRDARAEEYDRMSTWAEQKRRLRKMKHLYTAWDKDACAEVERVVKQAESVMEELRKNPPKLIERWWIHDYMYGLRKKACDMEEALWEDCKWYDPVWRADFELLVEAAIAENVRRRGGPLVIPPAETSTDSLSVPSTSL